MKAQNPIKSEMTDSTLLKPQSAEASQKSSPITWKSVLVGGVPGILIGSSLAVPSILSAVDGAQDDVQEMTTDEAQDSELGYYEVHEAHSVHDGMTFAEAFASARAEVGPRGAFVWHGHVYGTYRGDDVEWQEMSVEDREAYSNHVLSQVHATPYTPDGNEPEIVEAPSGEHVEEIEDEVDVHFVGIDSPDAAEDGSDIQASPTGVVFFDVDGDGQVDLVTLDETPDVSEPGISMDDFGSDIPDYTNDADLGGLL